ncbi:hypothetical protein JTE90_023017, partial [Oedothorax gibbosus]
LDLKVLQKFIKRRQLSWHPDKNKNNPKKAVFVPGPFFRSDSCRRAGKEGEPKKRYTALTGEYNCGKTSIGFAFLKLFSGVSINCNIDFGRIGFFLGESIGQRFVLFDDASSKGMKNLDELRDHLDGRIQVQLEKNCYEEPIMQTFPAGIITSNHELLNNLKVCPMFPCDTQEVMGPSRVFFIEVSPLLKQS